MREHKLVREKVPQLFLQAVSENEAPTTCRFLCLLGFALDESSEDVLSFFNWNIRLRMPRLSALPMAIVINPRRGSEKQNRTRLFSPCSLARSVA